MAQGNRWHAAENLGDVSALCGEGPGTSGPLRIISEQMAVFFHRGAATCGIDDDGVDAGGFEERNEFAGHGGGLIFEAGVDHEGPAAWLATWNDDLETFRAEHACGRGVDVREKSLLDATSEHADATASRGHGGYKFWHGPGEARGDSGENSFHGGKAFGQELQKTGGPNEGLHAGALIEKERAGHEPETPWIREGGEEEFAEERVSAGARNIALDLRPAVFDELVVLDA
jgi:hypothetical protein